HDRRWRDNAGVGNVPVDDLLDDAGRWQRHQGLAFDRRPRDRRATDGVLVVRTNDNKRETKEGRAPNAGCPAENAERDVEVAGLDAPADRGEVRVEKSDAQVRTMDVELFDGMRENVACHER